MLMLLQCKQAHSLASSPCPGDHKCASYKYDNSLLSCGADNSAADMTVSLIDYEDALSEIVAVAQLREPCLLENYKSQVGRHGLPIVRLAG